MNTNIAQKGFTLIELVVVMVILGILAAVAIPAYVDLRTQARIASLNGLAGAVNSAAQSLVKGKYFAVGGQPTYIYLQGVTGTGVTIASGLPNAVNEGVPDATAVGILNALVPGTATANTLNSAQYFFVPGVATGAAVFTLNSAGFNGGTNTTAATTACGVVYNAGTSEVNTAGPGQAVAITSGC